MNRITESKHGASLKLAIKGERPWLKSEDLPSFRRFYVNESVLETIHNNSNHLIVGRRGTGKTHLLGTFREYINDDCDTELAIGVSILDAAHNQSSPPASGNENLAFENKKAAATVFTGFLRMLAKELERSVDKKKECYKKKLHFLKYRKINKEGKNLISKLFYEINFGSSPQKAKSTEQILSVDGTSQNILMKGGVNTSIKPIEAKAEGSASVTGESESEKSRIITKQLEQHLYTDLYKIKNIILEILNLLEIELLFILIDEWMELDKRRPSGIQPLFAQLLKKSFFNEKRFSVKIASVWHLTTLYDKDHLERSKGVQLHHDIQCAVDLDTIFFTSESKVCNFFKELLFKRLVYLHKDLSSLEKNGLVQDKFIDEVFDGMENFKALILASHGIPRDFMHIFLTCANEIKGEFETNCINKEIIFNVTADHYKRIKRKNIDSASVAQKLLEEINSYMNSTGRRYFIVKNNAALESLSLKKLVDEELIHQIPSAVTPRTIRDKFKAFYIDLGNYIDWARENNTNRLQEQTLSIIPEFPEDISDENASRYEIKPIYEDKGMVVCTNILCGYIFDSINPVYKKFSSCPSCANTINC